MAFALGNMSLWKLFSCSQSASYQDVVSPGERFNEPVPLAKMVKSLVEIWGEGY